MMHTNIDIDNYWKSVVFESDSRAFECLFHKLQNKCIRFCMRFVDSRETAEDIVSDVFADLWVGRNRLQEVRDPEVYVLISIRNKSSKHWKKKAKMEIVPLDDLHDKVSDEYRPDHELEKKELMLTLDKAIDKLPLQCKTVFKLVKEDGLKCAQVAEILDISIRTVHTQMYRAMNKINTTISEQFPADPKVIKISVATGLIILYFFLNLL
jgi:RNA polymerase sigma-70 factor (ECF subfamily)